ncbi:solute carrier family 28 member 3-like [Haliotis rufescens]|uniref:solute carrier family 28 member 3-like n=1 Tax=Haliotis rufescens TaxID=6454 RepID=UPI00201F3C73|nr:solute carrier family 28 member 3-like [Haliotis rufescens]XP_046369657.2 solute carrier family 28 member 3-like [Haliotis rufescens]XP_046369658.2 solute carrier family 28 member 3-like [Haliotis rufescens]
MGEVQLKQINPLVADSTGNGQDNPAYVHSSIDSLPNTQEETGLRHRKNSLPYDPENQMDDDMNCCQRGLTSAQRKVISVYEENATWIWRIIAIVVFLLYMAYFGYAMYYKFGDEASIRLLVLTIFVVFLIVMKLVWDSIKAPFEACGKTFTNTDNAKRMRVVRYVMYVLCVIAIIVILVIEVAIPTPDNLISLAGLAAFIILCFITSTNPGRVDWHPVFWGLALQFFFAAIILRTQWGYDAFKWLGDRVTEFLAHTNAGSEFVFDKPGLHFFAFSIMPVVTFFSAFISITYYLGIMQAIVKVFGRFLSFCLGTTPAESLNAAGNIFVGMTEAPLMIKPFLDTMTISELHAVMTGGFATIAGSVLGAYIGFGVPPNHLLSASVMSAPAALAISKLMCPETEVTISSSEDYNKMKKGQQRNLIEAASEGASTSIGLIANIVVNVMAFLALLAFVNATLTWFGDRVGIEGLTFELICSYLLYPVALFMGTQPSDCRRVAELIGVKTFTNEFIAYKSLQELLQNRQTFLNYTQNYGYQDDWHWDGQAAVLTQWNMTLKRGFMEERSEVISTYALCGFSNVGSMGILLGGLSALAPSRKKDLSSIVLRAMIAGNMACFFTACIAGLFFKEF